MFPRLVKVTDERFIPEIVVESKGYIMVRIGRNSHATTVYWHFVDPVFSLLELGFESPSGRLIDCSIPLFNGEVENGEIDPLGDTVVGAPYFDLSKWPLRITEKGVFGHVIDEQGRIRLVRSQNALSIIAKESPRSRSVLYGDTLVCHFDKEDELSALTLRGTFSV